ncbi:MAG: cytochrome c biogenesis protein CcsA [Spirochaetes bacterium]|nr:cytochrome c biogenesis protein CcsA [Spirochaetota bacterium]
MYSIVYHLPWLSAVLVAASLVFSVQSFKKGSLLKLAKYFYISATAVVGIMLGILIAGFIANWFEFTYVYNHSSVDLPLVYRIAALWAGQEGSFVLWAFFIMCTGIAVLQKKDNYEVVRLTLVGLVSLIFIVHIVNNNPFTLVWNTVTGFTPGVRPADGNGLNPLLQDFWMVIHPPVMFLGYAVAAVPFVYALIALIYNNYSVLLSSYRFVVATVLLLGAGNFLGGYWAYKVLGWGGYWGWDPVENSSLIPWLTSIALLHGLLLQKWHSALIRCNLVLAIVTFILILFGTFLTRSGILSDFSVHSFSGAGHFTDLLFFIVTIIMVSIGLLFYRKNEAKGKELSTSVLSRDNVLVYGIAVLVFFAAFVCIGTCMPLITDMLGQSSTVQQTYYTSIARPIAFLVVLLLILVPFIKPPKVTRAVVIGICAVLASSIIYIGHRITIIPFALMTLSFIVIFSNIKGFLPHIPVGLPARIAHIGVAVMIVGIITSYTQSLEHHVEISRGEKKSIPPVTLQLLGMTQEAEKTSIVFNYEYGNSSYVIQTPYFIDTRTNQLFREPYIDYSIGYDVYISPVEYIRGHDKLTQVMVSKGAVQQFVDLTIRFDGFDIDRAAMMQGNAKVYAECMVVYKGTRYTVKPGVQFANNNKQSIPAIIPGTDRTVTLMDFDIHEKIIVLHIDPPRNATVPADSVIVDISFKRLVWLVWLGTLLIGVGTAIPLFKRQ